MFHKIMAAANALFAALCLGVLLFGRATGDTPLVMGIGFLLFGGMALAVWHRSRWAWLPGSLLIALFTLYGFMFMLAVLWPDKTVNRLVASCLGVIVLEVASLIAARVPRAPARPYPAAE